MNYYRKLAALALALCCMAVHGQTTVDLHPSKPRLPGSAQNGHFRLDEKTRPSPWAANLGQSVVRAVALDHKMTSGPLVQYKPRESDCKFDRDARCP